MQIAFLQFDLCKAEEHGRSEVVLLELTRVHESEHLTRGRVVLSVVPLGKTGDASNPSESRKVGGAQTEVQK